MSNPAHESTATTCGTACWYATEAACRCPCRGRNHGRGRHLQPGLLELPEGPLRPPRVGDPPGLSAPLRPVQTKLEVN